MGEVTRPIDLVKKANENLKKVFSGEVRREYERKQRIEKERRISEKQYRSSLRVERVEKILQISKWRQEINDLQSGWGYLYDKLTDGTIHDSKKAGGEDEYAYLEEVDARINNLSEWIVSAEDRIFQIEWELR